MCGIFGSTFALTDETVNRKLGCIIRRGPDSSSFKKVGGDKLVMGHNRLAIVDLDARSNQPFVYRHVTMVYNGEIYNFKEIRKELVKAGYTFATTSDTEVVIAAYLEYGENCVDHFNGMFAFVMYDSEKDILFGSRDRLGKKPFYYVLTDDGFEFASQLSALEYGNEFKINKESLTRYLYWNYIPEPHTPYYDVYKLASATCFLYDLGTKQFKKWRFWDLPEYSAETKSYPEAKDKLKSLLRDAVEKRMISDVPLGIFLSGGVDSSLVAAIAQEQSDVPVKTFSIRFNEKEFDESEYSMKVAKLLGTEHTQIECSYEEGIDFIKNFEKYYDEPFADSSAIPSLLLSKYTRNKVTVALSGDGGDETFMGYNIYDVVRSRERIYRIPYLLRRIISAGFSVMPGIRARLISKALNLKDIRAFYLSYFTGVDRKWIRNRENNPEYIEYLKENTKPLMETISDFDTKTYLNGDCITKVERASMAFSLEVRSPLMDYRVVEFARSLPTDFKFSEGNKKRILKDVLYDYLPKEIFERKKAGFGMPLGIWFRNELKTFVYETLSEDNLSLVEDIIDKDEFLKIVEEHMSGQWNHTPSIWKVIVLINWLKSRQNSV